MILYYFEMNGFVEEKVTGSQYDSGSEAGVDFRSNHFYQEEIWKSDKQDFRIWTTNFRDGEARKFSLEAIPRSVFEAHLQEIQTNFLVAGAYS